jgi:hypothetical protein
VTVAVAVKEVPKVVVAGMPARAVEVVARLPALTVMR